MVDVFPNQTIGNHQLLETLTKSSSYYYCSQISFKRHMNTSNKWTTKFFVQNSQYNKRKVTHTIHFQQILPYANPIFNMPIPTLIKYHLTILFFQNIPYIFSLLIKRFPPVQTASTFSMQSFLLLLET